VRSATQMMETKDIIVVIVAVLSAGVTVSVPLVNHFLSRTKYADEKLWDLRRTAYSSIIFDLAETERHITLWVFKKDASDSPSFKDAYDAFERARNSMRASYVICSKDFREVFLTAEREFYDYATKRDLEVHTIMFQACVKALESLLAIATRELHL
jgi:hypothetical protein